jgi:hypothetical protein
MKALLIVLAFVGFTVSAHAGVIIQKAMDGTVATCDVNTKNPRNYKVISINLDKLNSNDSNEEGTLAVALVKCENGKWVPDTEPNLIKYTAPNGKAVTVTLNNFELFMVTQSSQIVLQTSLDYLNKSVSSQTTNFSLTKTRAPYQDFVIFVRFLQTVEAEGYKDTRWGTFGEYVVRLTNEEAPKPVPVP